MTVANGWIRPPRVVAVALTLLLATALPGCTPGVDTTYGRSRVPSINGTGTLAAMLRGGGHEVRSAVRLTEDLQNWADVIVRFAPMPGPPPRDEADWYANWLNAASGRRVVYVPRDYDAGPEYWTRVLEQLPKDATARLRERVREALDQSKQWDQELPDRAEEPAAPEDWFATRRAGEAASKPGPRPVPTPTSTPASPKPKRKARRGTGPFSVFGTGPVVPTRTCAKVGGPWGVGVDAAGAALPAREVLVVDSEEVLLTGDGDALAMSWTRFNDSRILVVANGSFLLNAAIAAHPARWPLARRVADWAGYSGEESEGESGATIPKRVAFVEGMFVLSGQAKSPSVLDLLGVAPFGQVVAQLVVLGLVACLARAPRLGRPRAEAPSGADRPVAHPEALGALLARTGQAREARFILESYRRWRTRPTSRGPSEPH